MDEQFKPTQQTMSQMDLKTLKIYLIEKMMPEYATITLFQVIQTLTMSLYYEKLKKDATKNFFKWVNKQMAPNSKLSSEIKHK